MSHIAISFIGFYNANFRHNSCLMWVLTGSRTSRSLVCRSPSYSVALAVSGIDREAEMVTGRGDSAEWRLARMDDSERAVPTDLGWLDGGPQMRAIRRVIANVA